MNVYDFDNTIYDGESTVDFYLFVLKQNWELALLFPKMIYMLARYKLCLISEQELMLEAEKYSSYILNKLDIDKLVPMFWDKNQRKIKDFYLQKKMDSDIVVSAGPDFLLCEICSRLGINNLISSQIDRNTGRIKQLCYKSKKVEIFKEIYPDVKIDEFYTDSMNDRPMFALANKVYLVKKNKIKELIL